MSSTEGGGEGGGDEEQAVISIPSARFIDDVASYMQGRELEAVIEGLNEQYRQLKMVESQLLQKKARLQSKLPEIKKALDCVLLLMEKEGSGEVMSADFSLSDGMYAAATLTGIRSVNLWLGAGIMVEYSLPDAKQLLETNLSNCTESLAANKKNLEFIKDNLTITEVSFARVYNFDVERRREGKGASA